VKISPLTRLLKKGQVYHWGSEQQTAFDDLKHNLLNSEVLVFPRFDLQFRLAVDTSSCFISYIMKIEKMYREL
jgi:hypothetical protein